MIFRAIAKVKAICIMQTILCWDEDAFNGSQDDTRRFVGTNEVETHAYIICISME